MQWLWGLFLLIFSQLAIAYEPPKVAQDLYAGSATCESVEALDLAPECDLRNNSFASVQEALEQYTSHEFVQDQKRKHIESAMSLLHQRISASSWALGTSLLKERDPLSNQVQRTLSKLERSCSRAPAFKDGGFLPHQTAIAQALSTDMSSQALTENVETERQIKEAFLKRLLVAGLEAERIRRTLNDYPRDPEEKLKLRDRLSKIYESYPNLASSGSSHLIQGRILDHYSEVQGELMWHAHPKIDQILFAEEGQFLPLASLRTRGGAGASGTEQLVNAVLSRPVPEALKEELRRNELSGLRHSLESMRRYCRLNSCQTVNMDLTGAAADLAQAPPETQPHIARALCACRLSNGNLPIPNQIEVGLSAVAIGGMVFCPLSFGAGCAASAAAGGLLSSMAIARGTVGAADALRAGPVGQAARAFPGLSATEKQRLDQQIHQSTGRIMATGAELAVIGLGGAARAVETGAPRQARPTVANGSRPRWIGLREVPTEASTAPLVNQGALIGRGSNGRVFHVEGQPDLVVKVPEASYSGGDDLIALAREISELQSRAAYNGPSFRGVVRVVDNEGNQRLGIVTDLVRGQTIQDLINEGRFSDEHYLAVKDVFRRIRADGGYFSDGHLGNIMIDSSTGRAMLVDGEIIKQGPAWRLEDIAENMDRNLDTMGRVNWRSGIDNVPQGVGQNLSPSVQLHLRNSDETVNMNFPMHIRRAPEHNSLAINILGAERPVLVGADGEFTLSLRRNQMSKEMADQFPFEGAHTLQIRGAVHSDSSIHIDQFYVESGNHLTGSRTYFMPQPITLP